MVTVAELKKKASSKYKDFLQSKITNDSFFPLEIPFNSSIDKDFQKFRVSMEDLIGNSKNNKSHSYDIEFKSTAHRTHGLQDIPDKIFFSSEADYLTFIGKKDEVKDFEYCTAIVLDAIPDLRNWCLNNVLKITSFKEKWGDILKVVCYFLDDPQPNLYVRELPIAVHTKFIEENTAIIKKLLEELLPNGRDSSCSDNFYSWLCIKKPEARIRFRILDEKLVSIFDDMEVLHSQFNSIEIACEKVFVVENLMNFLSFPKIDGAIVLWGKGFNVDILKSNKWLIDKQIYYWGDLDAAGMQILHMFRASFSHTRSFLMDEKTLSDFTSQAVCCDSSKYPPILKNLTEAEHDLYLLLRNSNLRLEQEKITHTYALDIISSL